MSIPKSIASAIAQPFTLDTRALSLMRVFIGLTLFGDVLNRFIDVEAFYFNDGLLPISFLFSGHFPTHSFSVYTISESEFITVCLFALHLLLTLLLIAGYKTRLISFLNLVFIISLNNRNPFILQGGDDLLQLTLLWGLFMPWGRFYSLDALRHGRKVSLSGSSFSMANVGYVLLLFSVYFFAALLKSSSEWRSSGEALYYALSIDQLRRPLGALLYPYADLLRVLTISTFYLELLAPFVLLIPFKNRHWRLLFFLLFTGFHIGIALCMNVGLFSLISVVVMIGLLPGYFMDNFDKWVKPLRAKLREAIAKSGVFNRLYSDNGEKGDWLSSDKPFVQAFLAFAVVFSLAWNISNIQRFPQPLAKAMSPVGQFLALDQYWGMFAPTVFKDDGWFLHLGLTETDRIIDIKHGLDSVSYEKPINGLAEFKNDRWRKYFEHYIYVSNIPMRTFFCQKLLSDYNQRAESERLKSVRIIYMKEVSLPDYAFSPPSEEIVCECNEPRTSNGQ